ncbi:MAG: dTMP kinase [Kofleriaceae bacterium]
MDDADFRPPPGDEPRPLFVAFEGIDGSGKTTVSNRVAARLAEAGLRVRHVREGGQLASATAENIRQLTRDQRNLALSPMAELLLYVARETQQLDECIRPALRSCDVVIADRFLSTGYVLATAGRGLDAARVAPIVAAAADGLAPDLTILIDVDPQVARARRRAEKVARPTVRTVAQGAVGAGLLRRLRQGYLGLARTGGVDGSAWVVVDNSTAELDAVVARVAALITEIRAGGAPTPLPELPVPSLAAPRARDPEDAREVFLAWVDAEATREPEVAGHLLAGTAGWGYDERRWLLVDRVPAIIANGLGGLGDEVSHALREHLRASQPALVARSLQRLDDAEAWRLREALAEVAPDGVAVSLAGLGHERAWAMRRRLWPRASARVVKSLVGDGGAEAWALREAYLAELGGDDALVRPDLAKIVCRSLRGVGGPRAWALRERAWQGSPAGALQSLAGLDEPEAWAWRERHLERAPVPVMTSIARMDHDHAWALREQVGRGCKEVLDSIVELDSARAWALRTALADVWPSTTVKSLGVLGTGERGRALTIAVLGRHAELSLLKHAAALARPSTVQAVAR